MLANTKFYERIRHPITWRQNNMTRSKKYWYQNNNFEELQEILCDRAAELVARVNRGEPVSNSELAIICNAVANGKKVDALESISYHVKELAENLVP